MLATDGVSGPIDTETLVLSLEDGNFMQAVPRLLDKSELAGGPHGDNLSIIAVRWDDNYEAPTEDAISTHTMAMDEVQTQMQEFGRSTQTERTKKLDLTEDEIEKAITEIRAAINKFSK